MKCTGRKERAGGDEQMAGLETRPAGKFSFPFFYCTFILLLAYSHVYSFFFVIYLTFCHFLSCWK